MKMTDFRVNEITFSPADRRCDRRAQYPRGDL